MAKTNKFLNISAKVLLNIAFPLIIFLVMLIITSAKGIDYYATTLMLKTVSVDTVMSTIVALAIYVQIKNGRFDFSGGATMVLSAMIAGNIVLQFTNNALVYMIFCMIFGVIIGLITATAYVYTKVPIVIITIGMALFYESLTLALFNGEGLNTVSNVPMLKLAHFPAVFIVLAIGVGVFVFYNYFTKSGRESKLLSCNQKVSTNIGISEKKNVFVAYAVFGLLLGLGGMIQSSKAPLVPQLNLSTAGLLFSNIVPVFIGMFLARASKDVVGIIMAALGLAFLSYGLDCLGMGAGGYQKIIFGVFMMSVYTLSAKFDDILAFFKGLKAKRLEKKGEGNLKE